MNDERQKLKEKQFSSLNRGLSKKKVGNRLNPLNTLTSKGDSHSIQETRSGLLKDKCFSTNEKLKKSEKLRLQINKKVNHETFDEQTESELQDNVKDRNNDIFSFPVETQFGTQSNDFKIKIISVDFSGRVYRSQINNSLELNISSFDNRIFFKDEGIEIEELEIRKDSNLERIQFGYHSLLILLDSKTNYMFVRYLGDDSELWARLKKSVWKVYSGRCSNEDLLKQKNEVLSWRASKGIQKKSKNEVEDSKEISAISPSLMYGDRVTRSQRKLKGETSSDPINIGEHRDTPAPFDPPLKHAFAHNKLFTVTYSDFKTLYNKDWINDTIIDFFITYEVEKAIYDQHLMSEEEIYVFNSFFFIKLMDNNRGSKTDYYQNVKKWLTKVDIMKYSSVIIPINENAHWYCCVIRGLPDLLSSSRGEEEDSSSFSKENDNEREQCSSHENEEQFNESSNMDTKLEHPTPSKQSKVSRGEIFVFDSLGQSHAHIHGPLKQFILDYCKDKYGIEIKKERLRVQNARVPRQNNFNDCGIHVIYNVRKWLSNRHECERLWRSSQSRHSMRLFFVAEERNKMRKELITILKELHELQTENLSRSNDAESNWESYEKAEEDDVQVIEYPPNEDPNGPKGKVEPKTDETELIKYETLDPKSKEPINLVPSLLKNEYLNTALSGMKLKSKIISFLNDEFPKKNGKVDAIKKSIIIDMVKESEGYEEDEQAKLIELLKVYKKKLANVSDGVEVTQRKYDAFRIEHEKGITEASGLNYSESMNEDLSHLQISDVSFPVDTCSKSDADKDMTKNKFIMHSNSLPYESSKNLILSGNQTKRRKME